MTIDEFLQRLAERGLRITEQRRTLAQLFIETEGYLTPRDLYEQMEKQYTGLSFDTVYRNIKLMHELGLIEQFVFEDGLKFRLHCSEVHHHHHLICMDCEKTVPLSFCPMQFLKDIPERFSVVNHKFEVYGYCSDCQQDQKVASQ